MLVEAAHRFAVRGRSRRGYGSRLEPGVRFRAAIARPRRAGEQTRGGNDGPPPPSPRIGQSAVRQRMAATRPTVLVVEDEPLVRHIIVAELEDAGYAIVEAANAQAAIDVLADARSVDLLFTDIRMPGALDGWQIAERARELRPGLPVIYATGFSDEAPRLVPGGVFFKKPYRASAIIAAIEDLGVRP